MRELLFRAWDSEYERWEHLPETGNIDLWTDDPMIFAFDYCGEIFTIEQYTGLKDKNGKRIYEGDIVEFDAKEWGDNITNKHLVSWDESEASFCFGGGLNNENEFRTVIGNIHENPELIANN